MKRMLSYLVALVMLLFVVISPAPAVATDGSSGDTVFFILETVEAEPDSDFSVSLTMEGDYAATALTVFVDYDPDLLSNKGSLSKGAVWYDILDAEGMVQTSVNNPGRIGFMAIVADGDFSSTGVVFSINFHVSADVDAGTTIPLTVTVSQFTYDELNGNVIHLPYSVADGAVIIPAEGPTPTPEPTPEPTAEPPAVLFALETVEAAPDTDVSVAFSVDGEYAATALTVFVDYDPALLTNNGSLSKGEVWHDILDAEGMVQTSVNTPGRIGFMAIVVDGDFSSTGVVFSINFHVSADADPGTTIPLAVTISQFTYDELSGNVIHIPYESTDGAVIVLGGYHISVGDYTKGKASASVSEDQLYSGEVTFTVTCSLACVVAFANGDGTYTRLACTTENGEHKFTVTVDADVSIIIAVKGDINLNGKVETVDSTLIKRAVSNVTPLSGDTAAIKCLAADVNGNGTLQTVDSTLVLRAVANLYTIQW